MGMVDNNGWCKRLPRRGASVDGVLISSCGIGLLAPQRDAPP